MVDLISQLWFTKIMKKVDKKLYVFEDSIKIMPGVSFELRSTLIEISNNKLLIISPAKMKDEELIAIANKYEQVICVAPNILHNKYLLNTLRNIPQAKIFGPEALLKKIPQLRGRLNSTEELDGELDNQVSIYPIHISSDLVEIEFFHRPTETLILTDLIFNMREPMPIGRRLILKMVGAHDKVGQSQLVKKSIRDKAKYLNSIEKLEKTNPRRIIFGHGSVLDDPDWKTIIDSCKDV